MVEYIVIISTLKIFSFQFCLICPPKSPMSLSNHRCPAAASDFRGPAADPGGILRDGKPGRRRIPRLIIDPSIVCRRRWGALHNIGRRRVIQDFGKVIHVHACNGSTFQFTCTRPARLTMHVFIKGQARLAKGTVSPALTNFSRCGSLLLIHSIGKRVQRDIYQDLYLPWVCMEGDVA